MRFWVNLLPWFLIKIIVKKFTHHIFTVGHIPNCAAWHIETKGKWIYYFVAVPKGVKE